MTEKTSQMLFSEPVPAWRQIAKPREFHISDERWHLLCHNAFYNWHTLIVGPTGAGKTRIVEYVAKAVGKNFVPFNCGEFSDMIGALKGTTHLKKRGSAMETVFVRSPLINALSGEGNLVLLDETPRSPQEVMNQLFSILDHQKRIEIAEEDPPVNLTLGKGTVCFATANIGTEYTGTTVIDAAFRDRFMLVTMEYLKPDIEAKLVSTQVGLSEEQAKQLSQFAHEARLLFKRGELPSAWSTRQSLRAATLVKHGFPIEQAILLISEGLYYTGEEGELNDYMVKINQIIQKL